MIFLYKNSNVNISSNILNKMLTKHLKLFLSHLNTSDIRLLYQIFCKTNHILIAFYYFCKQPKIQVYSFKLQY